MVNLAIKRSTKPCSVGLVAGGAGRGYLVRLKQAAIGIKDKAIFQRGLVIGGAGGQEKAEGVISLR